LGRNKKYSGYKSYSYLEPGLDYKVFEFRDPLKHLWIYPLSKTEEERAESIIEKNILIDLHIHPNPGPDDISQERDWLKEGRKFIAYSALAKSGLDAFIDWQGPARVTSKRGWKWHELIDTLGMALCDIGHQDFVVQCKKANDIKEAYKDGKVAWIPGIESATHIENELDRLDILYGLGIRSVGICFSQSNMLGSGLAEMRDAGLTDFGYDAVVRMNKLGMLIDVSHTSDLTAMDTIELSKDPILASHVGTRTLTPTSRMFPDDLLQDLAENGGLLGIEAPPNSTVTEKNPVHNLESFMEHIVYCMELMGVEHVGVGSDTYYFDHVGEYLQNRKNALTEGFGRMKRPDQGVRRIPNTNFSVESLERLKYVKGAENPTECTQNVVRWMVHHGYSDIEIAKVVGANALKLFERVWGTP
jgi:membrane dipeptidase